MAGLPGSRGARMRDGVDLEQRLAQASFEILAREAPGEQLAKCGVASAEGMSDASAFLGGWCRSFGVSTFRWRNREIDLDLIEPTRMVRRMHDDDARMARRGALRRRVPRDGTSRYRRSRTRGAPSGTAPDS